MSRIISLAIVFIIFLGLETYLYFVFKTHFNQKSTGLKIFTVIWFIVPVVCIALAAFSPMMSRLGRTWVTNIVMIVFLSVLLTSIVVFIGDVARVFFNYIFTPKDEKVSLSRRKMIVNLGLVALSIPMITMFYGLFKTAYDFKVTRLKIKFPNLPEGFNGFKFVQVSDIHTGSFLRREELGEAVNLMLEEKPDVIFFTGDLVNNRTDEAYPFIPALKRIQAPMGVYSTIGNHDYGDYEAWPSPEAKIENFDALIKLHADLGWKLLNNAHVILEKGEDKIAVVGVENWGAALRFPRKGDVVKAKAGTENIPFKILLSHDPSHWDAQIVKDHKDMDLMLAGHTHGFQFGIEIPGFKWSPSQWIYKQWAGLYQNGKQYIYVNRGLGCLGYSGRVGIRPEITVIELERG